MEKLSNIPLNEIDFGIRHRQDYGDLEALYTDIKSHGLIHPIRVVDKQAVGQEDLKGISTDPRKQYLLMVGGRRFRAYEKYEISTTINAIVHSKVLSSYELRKIELIENISRKEMTWQEEATLTGELHDLEQKKHGKSSTSAKKGHSLQDTADMLGKSKSSVKNEVDLAAALKHLPDLKNIKNKSDAIKVMRQMNKSSKAEKVAAKARESAERNPEGVKQNLMISFVCGDFFAYEEKLPENTFDFIEIDPPYGIDLGNIKKGSKHTTLNYNEVPSTEYEAFMRRTFLYAKKLLKPNGWLVCWYAIAPWHQTILNLLHDTGFKTNGLPALWIKGVGQTNRMHQYFGSAYEPFFYARLSDSAVLNKQGVNNYLVHPPVYHERKIHPTQRPIS